MRKFQNQNWAYSISQFEKLAKEKEWSVRFRLEYSYLRSKHLTTLSRIKVFITYGLSIVKLLWYCLSQKSFAPKGVLILISYNKTYLQHLLPVIVEMKSRGIDYTILCPANQLERLEDTLQNEDLVTYESLLTGSFFRKLLQVFKALFKAILDTIWFSNRKLDNSLSFSTAFQRYAFTEYLFRNRVAELLKSAPVLLAANDHWMWESLFFRSASKLNVKNYILQHGVLEEISYPMFSSTFLAWGKYDANKLKESFGAQEKEVLEIGSPYFDSIYKSIQSQTLSQELFNAPYITFLAQPFIQDGYLSEDTYLRIIKRFCNLEIIANKYKKKLLIKLHPREKRQFYEKATSGSVLIDDSPLFDILSKSCLAITVDSTAIFEAVMCSVPAVQTLNFDAERKIDFSDTGISITTSSTEELITTVENLLSDKNAYMKSVQNSGASLNAYFNGLSESLDRIMELTKSLKPPTSSST